MAGSVPAIPRAVSEFQTTPPPQLLGPGSFLPSSPDTRDGGSQQVLEQKEGRDTSSIYPC